MPCLTPAWAGQADPRPAQTLQVSGRLKPSGQQFHNAYFAGRGLFRAWRRWATARAQTQATAPRPVAATARRLRAGPETFTACREPCHEHCHDHCLERL